MEWKGRGGAEGYTDEGGGGDRARRLLCCGVELGHRSCFVWTCRHGAMQFVTPDANRASNAAFCERGSVLSSLLLTCKTGAEFGAGVVTWRVSTDRTVCGCRPAGPARMVLFL